MARRLTPPLLIGLLAGAFLIWTAMAGGYLWTDYEYANVVPFHALAGGHWGLFFHSAPIEGPSLLLRAPFALLPSLWGGGDTAIYYAVAVPGVLATVVLGTLLYDMRARLGQRLWPLVILLLAVANPVSSHALQTGHPEELFGTVLCVTAVLAALNDRPTLAAVLLGFALANKAWAVLAIGPVLIALPPARRLSSLVIAGGIAAACLAPFMLSGGGRSAVASAGSTDQVFQPWQVFWFIGHHDGTAIRGFGGALKEGYRSAPAWIAPITHPLIALLVVPATAVWVRVRGWQRSPDVLLLLAWLFLARCMLDVADNEYYHVPFILTLLAWETQRSSRPPVFAGLATLAVWLTTLKTTDWLSADGQAAVYLVVAVAGMTALTVSAFGLRLPSGNRRLVAAN